MCNNTEFIYRPSTYSISEIYKGDDITTCKWCGNTGWMHTFGNGGEIYSDAPCICKLGQEILDEKLKEE